MIKTSKQSKRSSKRNKRRMNVFSKRNTGKLLFIAYGSPVSTKVLKISCPGWTSS